MSDEKRRFDPKKRRRSLTDYFITVGIFKHIEKIVAMFATVITGILINMKRDDNEEKE